MGKIFWIECKERIIRPWEFSAFKGYFWTFVVFFGILGVGISVYFYEEKSSIVKVIASSMSTYFIALMASSMIEVILSFTTDNKASFTIYSVFAFIIGSILVVLSNALSDWGIIPAAFGMILSFLLWIIANADNPKLNDENYSMVIKNKVSEHRNSIEDEEFN